ncbi:21157_t:CDS:1, partial [Rhizophagus irregularis]
MNLDDYHKKFMFACKHPDIARVKHLEIFTDIVKDSDIMEYYIELDLFRWWHKQNENSLKLYVNNYTQWENLKNLILHKYPSTREIKR